MNVYLESTKVKPHKLHANSVKGANILEKKNKLYHNSLLSQPSCKKCSPGKYENTNEQTASDCKKCAVGYYQNEEATSICKNCQPENTTGTPENTTGTPDGIIREREGNYYGFQDSQGQTNCKACKGG